jgi:TRAP-type C4-dicarboxylate transport system permease small subunit
VAALEKFERFNKTISTWMERIGFFFVFLLVLITTVDVVGSKVFLKPLFGSIDFVMLSQLLAATLASSAALIAGRHVQADFFVVMLPKRPRSIVDSIANFLGLVLFILLVYRLLAYGYSLRDANEVSATARVALYPFAYGAAIGCLPICLVYISSLIRSIQRIFENES